MEQYRDRVDQSTGALAGRKLTSHSLAVNDGRRGYALHIQKGELSGQGAPRDCRPMPSLPVRNRPDLNMPLCTVRKCG